MTYMNIDQNLKYEESQRNVTKFIKSLICKNIEIPIDVPNENEYDGLQWKIDYASIKRILNILSKIDVRHWKYLIYHSYRCIGARTWKEALYGQYVFELYGKNLKKDKYFVFDDITINISRDKIIISCIVYDKNRNDCTSKWFYNADEFIDYYNNVTKNL